MGSVRRAPSWAAPRCIRDARFRPLRLGPDPNRTHLERWNEMHPDRYGRPVTPAEMENGPHRWLSLDDVDNSPGNAPSCHGFLESLLGLTILILAPIIGLLVTLPLYQWTRPDNLTPAWILGYAGVFVVATFAGGVLVYTLRRVLLMLALAIMMYGIGYAAWHLWLA